MRHNDRRRANPFRLRSKQDGYGTHMLKNFVFIFAAIAVLSPSQALVARRDDQVSLRQDVKKGEALTQREIEARILPKMRGMEYLGPEYVSSSQIYRLKFINQDRVIFVDVDARTGSILRQR
jgi:uncharacterized membrane protein YkoI